MITIEYSLQKRRYGAVDDKNNIIIPFEYLDVIIQHNGVLAKDSNNRWVVFTLSGQKKCHIQELYLNNLLILNDGNILFSDSKTLTCGIIDCTTGKFLLNCCDAILFFPGVSYQSLAYTANNDIFETIDETYWQVGAFLENRISVKRQGLWGVFYYPSCKQIVKCIYPNILQNQFGYIVATNDNGERFSL